MVKTIMVTHKLRYAVEYDFGILMMHEGHTVMNRSGEEKAATAVEEILSIFNAISIECGN